MHAPIKQTYTTRTQPMAHQAEALRRLASKPAKPCPTDVFAYLMEMGTGKSWLILAEWQEAVNRGGLRDLLVLAPAGSYRNWFIDKNEDQQSELRAHLDPRLYKDMVIAGWTDGAESRRQRERLLAESTRPRTLFVNIEALSSGGNAEALCKEFLTPGHAMMVIDESTRIRGKKAERRKAVMRLKSLAKARRICTGEVAPKSPLDLYWQFYFLDPRILGFDSYVAFQARYAVTKKACFLPQAVLRARFLAAAGVSTDKSQTGATIVRLPPATLRRKLSQIYDATVDPYMPLHQVVDEIKAAAEGMKRDQLVEALVRMAGGGYVRDVIPKIEGFRHVEELHARIAPYSHRVLKKDCLDLKPKIYMPPRDVPMTAEQKRIYVEIKKYATSELSLMSHVTATTVITKMIRLHQVVCGHTRDDDKMLRDIPSNRCAAVLEVLAEHSGKAIIWTTYDPEVRKIAAAIKREYGLYSCAMFWGGNKSTRSDDEKHFLSDSACRFMVSTQATGGMGNTWNVATLVVYAANSYDLELRVQSEDRCHRKGQTESVTYVDLCCAGTVEEKIIEALRGKMDLATIVNGDDYRQWLI